MQNFFLTNTPTIHPITTTTNKHAATLLQGHARSSVSQSIIHVRGP